MNIKTVILLSLSVVISDCTFFDTCAYADESAEDVRPSVTDSPNKAENKQGRRTKKVGNAKTIETFYPTLPDESAYLPASTHAGPLQGSATYVEVGPRFGDAVHRLTKAALERDPKYEKTALAVDHFRTKFQRTLRFTKDAVNYAYPYRGFSMSIEGSRLVLDKNQKLSNLCIAELTKQRYWDEMHPKITAKIMQIAMGLGMEKSEQSNIAIQKGLTGLEELVGKEAAQETLTELTEWKSQLNIPEPIFQQATWDVDTTERIYQNALKISAEGDPLIHHIFKGVKKYDHGKLANFAAGVVEANLSAVTVLSGSPVISLAAEGANTAFVMVTGGPEENKILKELYFGRRLEIRRKRISDEMELALTNYEKALLTHNGTQLAISEVVLAELVGPEKIASVLERDPINDFTLTAPIELAKEDTK